MSKVLAWSSLATMMLFAILASIGLFAWEAVGAVTAQNLILGSIFLLITSMLLAITLLVLESFASGESAEPAAVTPAEHKPPGAVFPDFPGTDEPAEPVADAEPPPETAPETDTDDDF